MVISYQSNGTVSIKAKNETIAIGEGITIGSYKIQSAGEYDVAGIQCDATHLETATAFLVRTEDLTVTFLNNVDTSITKLDEASNTDILIIDVRSDSKIEDVKTILKTVEPFYLLLIGSGASSGILQELGLPLIEGQLKVTRTSLPLEGTQLLQP